MADETLKCTQPVRGPIAASETSAAPDASPREQQKEISMQARVGKPAPDFEANACVGGSFKKVTLSDYAGQWILLCFYPGDFTFV